MGSRTVEKSVTVDKTEFFILQFNANGLGPAKIQELNKFLSDRKIQVALIQEVRTRMCRPVFQGILPIGAPVERNVRVCSLSSITPWMLRYPILKPMMGMTYS